MSVLSTLPSSAFVSAQCHRVALAISGSKPDPSSLNGVAAEALPAARFGLITCIGSDNNEDVWDLAIGVTSIYTLVKTGGAWSLGNRRWDKVK